MDGPRGEGAREPAAGVTGLVDGAALMAAAVDAAVQVQVPAEQAQALQEAAQLAAAALAADVVPQVSYVYCRPF